jgi:hypothetical protein
LATIQQLLATIQQQQLLATIQQQLTQQVVGKHAARCTSTLQALASAACHAGHLEAIWNGASAAKVGMPSGRFL